MIREWKLQSELMSFSEVEGGHSAHGENLGAEMYEVLKKFSMCEKVEIIGPSLSVTNQILDAECDF